MATIPALSRDIGISMNFFSCSGAEAKERKDALKAWRALVVIQRFNLVESCVSMFR
jgi:hypothetical protein